MNLSLRTKLSGMLLVVTIGVGLTAYYQRALLQDSSGRFEELVNVDFARLETLEEIRSLSVDIWLLYLTERGQEDISINSVQQIIDGARLKVDSLEQSYINNSEEQNADELEQFTVMIGLVRELIDSTESLIRLGDNQVLRADINILEAQTELKYQEVIESVSDLHAIETDSIDEENRELSADVDRFVKNAAWFSSGIILVSLALGTVVVDRMVRSITRLKRGAERIANGDFSQEVELKSKDELGQLAEVFNSMSERLKVSYRRIATQNQRDEIILSSMGEGLIATDEKGHVLLINDHAVRTLDLEDKTALVGQPAGKLVPLRDEISNRTISSNNHPIKLATRTGKLTSTVYKYERRGGTRILINISASPILVDEKIAGTIMIIRDVTKEKEIDRMKTEFISLASHQLRTPLSAIRWFSEMLLSGDAGKLKPEQADFATNIAQSTERMIELVNSLLNISRIESGRIIVDPKATDLNELVSGIVSDLKAKIEERQQSLIISVHKDLPKINLDQKLIGQVYLNLLTNAIKYSPKGGEISVFISKKDNQVLSQITDNGYGIPKDEQGKMFNKFFRATNISKIETDGTGLGMYLVKAIVESSGGKIWFDSTEGKGTTFWFTLPMSGMQAKQGEVSLDV